MSSNVNCLKNSKKQPPYQLIEALQVQKEQMSKLTTEICNIKSKLWENLAHKEWLEQHYSKVKNDPGSNNTFFQDLKEKLSSCKGTKLEKLTSGLIKAYEKFQDQTAALTFLSNEKEEILQSYKKTTNSLSQESHLKNKFKSLQVLSETREKNINELEKSLKKTRQDHQDVKKYLDSCEVKNLFEARDKIIEETEKVRKSQQVIMIEINKIDQNIELEKNVAKITPETTNKLLKKKITETENEIAGILKKIRIKEKGKKEARVSYQKMSPQGRKKSDTWIVNSCRSLTSLYTPNSKMGGNKSLGLSPDKFMRTSGNLLDLDMLSPERDKTVRLLSKGFNAKSTKKIEETMNRIGIEKQSFATKLVLLNREGFTNKIK
ncbi:hypothetical protein SteCoe_21779 [Stentor coeruleus]|uniref:Uncharacterized protein n=1 Tax=Stentor coeruleus TaxID=5963 RepID=A0A1R2BNS4_9CILI|nr:hypothetical protein SteCoe_21779 [Stentor coeruleus]